MDRRYFLAGSLAGAAFLTGRPAVSFGDDTALSADATARLDHFIAAQMAARHIPGLSACLIADDRIVWQRSYGFADLKTRVSMTGDHIQNIASISKTFTTLAAMQQVEAGLMSLDADVNDYLPFPLRHPAHPDLPITVRMLMLHTSGLRDGMAYARHYACGDPRMSLGTWIVEYFKDDGVFYNATEHFAPYAPGSTYEYSNVAFGLLGHLVEITSGLPLPAYCRRNIFVPLGLHNTGWMIEELDMSSHATPYTWVDDGVARGPTWGGTPLGVIRADGATLNEPLADGYQANCAYNHPNYPDGFLRTSVSQLAVWARLWLNDGKVDGVRLLQTDTVRQMFQSEAEEEDGTTYRQGLTWYSNRALDGHTLWGHSGSDPGVSTDLLMLRDKKLGAIVFTNTNGAGPADFATEILREGLAAF